MGKAEAKGSRLVGPMRLARFGPKWLTTVLAKAKARVELGSVDNRPWSKTID